MKTLKWLLAFACLCIATSRTHAADEDVSTQFFETHTSPIDVQEQGERILFANRQIGLEFRRSPGGFQLRRLYGIAERQEFLTAGSAAEFRDLFQIMMTLDPKYVLKDERTQTKMGHYNIVDQMAGDAFAIGANAGKSVSWRREGTATETTLRLTWTKMDVREEKATLDAEVTVTLREGDPLSYWRINVRNRSERYGIAHVRFPLLLLRPIENAEDNAFLYPRSRGEQMESAFRMRNSEDFYPHAFNMQFQALYNKQSRKGIFLGTRDPAPSLMCIEVFNRVDEITWRPTHFPPNIAFAEENFELPYDCVAGPFRGDWFDACQIYRAWALKQAWCRKGPLITRRDIPTWYKEAPLYFYTYLTDSTEGTHSLPENLQIAAAHMREFLKWTGMRFPANFYGWNEIRPGLTSYDVPFSRWRVRGSGRWAGMRSENAYGGNYPKIPALNNFAAECKRLRDDGGMVSPYVCLEIFDQGPSDNAPYAAEAKPNMIRDLYGNIRMWGIEPVWQPCPWTPWWQERLKETCVTLLNREHVGGIYLDTMQGSSFPCYWISHGHSAGGGSSSTIGEHELVQQIHDAVKASDPEAIITGENSAEGMIDVIDGALQVTLTPDATTPLFAAVYKDYIPRYGLELSTAPGDDFFIECSTLFVEGTQIGRIRLKPRAGALSFQNPAQKPLLEFLGQIVGYYRQPSARKFLAYGRLMRPLQFREPSPMPMLSLKDGAQFPALRSGVFRSDNGEIGVFIVNASNQEVQFKSELDPAQYGISSETTLRVDTFTPNGGSHTAVDGAKGAVDLAGTLPAHTIKMMRLKPEEH
jgi:hypothetical protein